MTRTRAGGLDVVRVVGVVAVVAGHAFSRHDWAGPTLFSWHVPIFFLLTGYLWTPGRTVAEEVRRRARTLLTPYVCWLVVVTAAWWLVVLHRGHHLHARFFGRLLKGGAHIGMPYSAFWFVTALFVAAVAYRLLEGIGGAWLVAAVGVVGLVWTQHDPVGVRSVWLAAGLAAPCLVFVVAGRALRVARPRLGPALPWGLAFLAAGVIGLHAGAGQLVLKSGAFPTSGVLVAIALSAGMVLVAEGVLPGALPPASVLAEGVLPVVLVHGMFLVVLADDPLDAPLAVFVAAVVGSWALALAARTSRPLRTLLL